MSPPAKNTWHVEIAPPVGARNKSHRTLVRLEGRPRTRAEAIREVKPALVTAMSQRCTGVAGRSLATMKRCGRYVRDGHLCRFHRKP